MKISVITVCMNAEDTILETLYSVASQTYKNIEHIIVDGQSTDKTLEIIKSFENKNLKIISEPDSGIYEAMNKGIKAAKR
jgi:glycosyltransferase involved in cell wall biosynthesis